MATAIMKQKEVPEMDDVEEIISKISEDSPYKRRPTQKRTWMTVPEMGKLLGLKKTDRYWLVHKNVFESKEIPKVGRVPLLRRMAGSVYTLPVIAILSSQVLNTKNQRNVYLQKKIMIRMMPKNMIMQMISQKNLGMEITMRGMTMLMITGKKEIR